MYVLYIYARTVEAYTGGRSISDFRGSILSRSYAYEWTPRFYDSSTRLVALFDGKWRKVSMTKAAPSKAERSRTLLNEMLQRFAHLENAAIRLIG